MSKQRRDPRPAFAVLGSGIIGMAVANLLLEKYPTASVTIYTDDASDIVTYVACAQFYPIWLGDHLPKNYDRILRKWFLSSKKIFIRHAEEDLAIVRRQNYELFEQKPETPAYFKDVLTDFHEGPNPNLPQPYTYYYSFETLIINPLEYLPQIRERFLSAGGQIVQKHIIDITDILSLPEPVIFNCLGMGACTVFEDTTMKPVKGFSLRLPPIAGLTCVISAGDFIVAPRKNDVLIGAPYMEKWTSTKPTKKEIKNLLANINNLVELPGLQMGVDKAALAEHNILEVRAGFRPVRDTGPRVEKEHIVNKTIIHNYGHGGNGVILSWGTAEEAIGLLDTP